MNAKNPVSDSSENAPIKRLVLRREKTRDLKVRSGVQTGGGGQFYSAPPPGLGPFSGLSRILPPPPK
jgi:hypothetical protein